MKKIAITLLALMLILCACSNQSGNKEDASNGASSVSGETEAGTKDSSTLPTEKNENEAGAVEFETMTGKKSDKKTTTKKKTTTTKKNSKNNSKKETTTNKGSKKKSETTMDSKKKESTSTTGAYELPRIPLS